MQVYKNIHLLGGNEPDSNIYLIDGEIIIDAGTGRNFGEIKKEIEALGHGGARMLVNTHCHFDHVGGNKKFRDWLKLEIAAHPADREAIETGAGSLAEIFGETSRVMTIDKLLRTGSTIKTKNFSFEVLSTPGHTPGSICLYEPSKKILFSGDTLFENTIGRMDLGGSRDQMISTLKKLSELEINYLFPGHGSPKIGGVNFLIKQMMQLLLSSSHI